MIALKDVRKVLELTGGENICRRYFITQGFDGALTALGIVLGAFLVKTPAAVIALMGVGASIALGISGFWIVFLTERAERTRDIKELETHLITDLANTRLTRANFIVSLIISTVNLSPMFFSLIALLPFFFFGFGLYSLQTAYIISFILIFIEVVVLGGLLGAISKENKLLYILKIIPAAILIAVFTISIDLITP